MFQSFVKFPGQLFTRWHINYFCNWLFDSYFNCTSYPESYTIALNIDFAVWLMHTKHFTHDQARYQKFFKIVRSMRIKFSIFNKNWFYLHNIIFFKMLKSNYKQINEYLWIERWTLPVIDFRWCACFNNNSKISVKQ